MRILRIEILMRYVLWQTPTDKSHKYQLLELKLKKNTTFTKFKILSDK
jgi:hypothetical protein